MKQSDVEIASRIGTIIHRIVELEKLSSEVIKYIDGEIKTIKEMLITIDAPAIDKSTGKTGWLNKELN
jgi:protein subunit release factor B